MKYFVCLGDGMADYRCAELNNKTPLEAAHKPTIDRLASGGIMGLCKTVPDHMVPITISSNRYYPPHHIPTKYVSRETSHLLEIANIR